MPIHKKDNTSMRKSKCSHIRIRDSSGCNIDVENFIKTVESQYNIDFRSLPQWKEIIQRLHVVDTDVRRKIQDAKLRKSVIIDKIYTQSTRLSPFELTADLARTAIKWNLMEVEQKRRKIVLLSELKLPDFEKEPLETLSSDSRHYNTEIISNTDEHISPKEPSLQADILTDTGFDSVPRLPPSIYTNPHKIISPIESRFSALKRKCVALDLETIESEQKEWLLFNPTNSIFTTPAKIYIHNSTLKQQFVQFSLTNTATDYLNIRFKSVTETSPFKQIKILPVTPIRLYPGIAVKFKFIFKLRNQENFMSALFFKVGRNIYTNAPTESLSIPIIGSFEKKRFISISETVSIAPAYLWQIRQNEHPTGLLNISVEDPYSYHLHIYKNINDLAKTTSSTSIDEMIPPKIQSVEDGVIRDDSAKSCGKLCPPSNPGNESDGSKTLEVVSTILNDVVGLALETFVFKNTYIHLKPHCKYRIPVYFTKAECIGKHQCCYVLQFHDPETDEVVQTKTISVFAEILPHPIQIYPNMLDMSTSPIIYGFCEDFFRVINTHRQYPVTIKIMLTTKMKQLFSVNPLTATIPASSSVKFVVRMCSRDSLLPKSSNDFVIFTVKIIVTGYRPIYENVTPFFYEIIAPLSVEFKKIYSEKFYKEFYDD